MCDPSIKLTVIELKMTRISHDDVDWSIICNPVHLFTAPSLLATARPIRCMVDHTVSMMVKVHDHNIVILPLVVGSGIQLGSTSVAFSGVLGADGEVVMVG
jgi:hypothetical protein